MKTLAIISMTQTARDNRVLRHVAALSQAFHIITIGFGPRPPGVIQHISIPPSLQYLPLNPTALIPHLLHLYQVSSTRTSAVRFVRVALDQLTVDAVLLNDVQTLPLMDSISVPVMVDMHEYAPLEMEEDWRFRIFLMRYYSWLCRRYLPRAACISTVSRSLAEEFSRIFGVNCSVILNARGELGLPVTKSSLPPLRLVHSGLAARARHLEVMIDAVANVPGVQLDLYLVQAPRQQAVLHRLKRRAQRTNNVRVMDPVTSDDLPEVISQYDLALIYISPSSFSLKHGIPNKLFDSIQARVGIVSGPSPDIVDFCRRTGVGVWTEHFSPIALRELLAQLTSEAVNAMREASDVTARQFNQHSEASKLLREVHAITSSAWGAK